MPVWQKEFNAKSIFCAAGLWNTIVAVRKDKPLLLGHKNNLVGRFKVSRQKGWMRCGKKFNAKYQSAGDTIVRIT